MGRVAQFPKVGGEVQCQGIQETRGVDYYRLDSAFLIWLPVAPRYGYDKLSREIISEENLFAEDPVMKESAPCVW